MSRRFFALGLNRLRTKSHIATSQSRAERSQRKSERFEQHRLAILQRRAAQLKRYFNAFKRAGSAFRLWWLMLLGVMSKVVRPINGRRRPAFRPLSVANVAPAIEGLVGRQLLTVLLDPSFDGDGKVTTEIGPADESPQSIAIDSSGRIVMAGFSFNGSTNDLALTRYNTDGSLDTTFGGDGKVTIDFGASLDEAERVAIDSIGRIVVAGVSDGNFAVARLNDDGTLDMDFDDDGMVTVDFGGNDGARGLQIGNDDTISVAGYSDASGTYDFALARFGTDGDLDSSFSDDGMLTMNFGADDVAEGLAIDSIGKIVVAGYSNTNGTYDFALTRLDANGDLDSTFGVIGTSLHDFGAEDVARDMTIADDGKIVLAGHSNVGNAPIDYDFALARFTTDGLIDTTFGNNGRVTTAIGAGVDGARSVVTDSRGRVVAAGHSHNGDNFDIALTRYKADGTPDTSFGVDGAFTTTIGSSEDGAEGVVIDSSGGIVVAGFSYNGADYDFAAIRLITGPQSFSVAENEPAGTIVGIFEPDVPIGSDNFAYSLVTGDGGIDNGLFRLEGNALLTNAPFNFEAQASRSIRVRVSGSSGETRDAVFTIAVSDVNEAPTGVTLTNITSNVPRNLGSEVPFKVADVVISDDALGVNSLSVTGADADKFEIIGTSLYVKAGVSFSGDVGSGVLVGVVANDTTGPIASANNTLVEPVIAQLITGANVFARNRPGGPFSDTYSEDRDIDESYYWFDGDSLRQGERKTVGGDNSARAAVDLISVSASTSSFGHFGGTVGSFGASVSASVDASTENFNRGGSVSAGADYAYVFSVSRTTTLHVILVTDADYDTGDPGSYPQVTLRRGFQWLVEYVPENGRGAYVLNYDLEPGTYTLGLAANGINTGGGFSTFAFKSNVSAIWGIGAMPGASSDSPLSTISGASLGLAGPAGQTSINIPITSGYGTVNPVYLQTTFGGGSRFSSDGSKFQAVSIPAALPNGLSEFTLNFNGSSHSVSSGTTFDFSQFAADGIDAFEIVPPARTATDSAVLSSLFTVGVQFATDGIATVSAGPIVVSPIAQQFQLTLGSDNNVPVAGDGNFSAAEDVVLTANLHDLVSDVETVDAALTYSQIDGPVLGLTLNADGTFTYLSPTPDFNGTVTFRYNVSDGWRNTGPQTVTINVAPVNDAPSITSNGGGPTSLIRVAENQTPVTRVRAADVDLPVQAVSFSISGGADASKFSINSATGILTFLVAPNFELPTDSDINGVYEVQVSATDNGTGNLSDSQDLSITIADVNEVPTVLTLTNVVVSIDEFTSVASRLRVAALKIDDVRGANVYTVTGPDAASVEVVGGKVYLKSGTFLNAAVKSSFFYTVSVTDTSLSTTPTTSVNGTLAVTSKVPTLTGPSATTTVLRPILTWTAVPGVARYSITLRKSVPVTATTPNGYAETKYVSTSNSYRPVVDLGIGQYTFYVQSLNSSNVAISRLSKGLGFAITTPVTVIPPAAIQAVARPTISWPVLPGAVSYNLQLENISTGTPTFVARPVGLTTTSWTHTADVPIGRYRIQVRGVDAKGVARDWSVPREFTVAPAPVPTAVASTFDRTPTFQWSRVAGATSYEIVVTKSGATVPTIQQVRTVLNFTPTTAMTDGQYLWKVRAIRTVGAVQYASAFSTNQTIFVGARPVALPVVVSGGVPTFSWFAVQGASSYQIRVDRLDVPTVNVINMSGLTGTSRTHTSSLSAGTYRFWVRAISTSPAETSTWSIAVDFTVAESVPMNEPADDSSEMFVVLNSVLPASVDSRSAESARKVSTDEHSSAGKPESRPIVAAEGVAFANDAASMPVFSVPVSASDMDKDTMALDEALIDAVLETLSVDGMVS